MILAQVNLLMLFAGQLGNMESRWFFTLLALHVFYFTRERWSSFRIVDSSDEELRTPRARHDTCFALNRYTPTLNAERILTVPISVSRLIELYTRNGDYIRQDKRRFEVIERSPTPTY